MAALGVVSALYGRRNAGRETRIDLSLLDVQISLQGHLGQFYLVSGEVPQPIGSSHHTNIPVGAYRTQDGQYVQVHCASQEFHEKLMRLLASEVDGLEGLPSDRRFATQNDRIANRDALDRIVSEALQTRPREEWLELLERWDVPGGPVNDLAEALANPQVRLRNMVVEIEHPVAGRYRTTGNPIKMGFEETFQPPPTLGQHTSEVLENLLGYSPEDIQSLEDADAI